MSPTAVQALLKADCSIMTPILEFRPATNPQTWNPVSFNYAYISEFNRYYYITDWTWKGPNWECALKVDPLASHKASITAANKYILRSASQRNIDIIDTLYSPTAVVSSTTVLKDFSLSPYYWNWTASSGYFVIGITNNGSYSLNGVTYYVFTQAKLRSMFEYLYLNITNMEWSDPDDWNAVISKAFIDPLDYITSAYWYPFDPKYDEPLPQYEEPIKFGFWNVKNISTGAVLTAPVINSPTKAFTWSFINPTNPYSNGNKWELLPPFATYSVEFAPFGIIPINAARAISNGGINCKLSVDFTTGVGLLNVSEYDATFSNTPLIAQKSALLGVPIPVGRQRDNLLPMLSDTVGAAGLTAGAATVAGAATALATMGLKAVYDVLSTNMQSSGTTGSLVGNSTVCRYIVTYAQPQAPNPTEYGYPICEYYQLSQLSGYTVCADGEIAGIMYDEERAAIEHYLTSGFYLE